MLVVMACWILAMMAGLLWARWAVAVLMGATVVTFLVVHSSVLRQPLGWFQLVAFALSPWLLAAQRTRHEKRTDRFQAMEAVRLTRLQEKARSLLRLQATSQQLDSQITQITNLYQVTKACIRDLRVEELFASSLEILPRLLDFQGLRLINLAHSQDSPPLVFRAQRRPEGRLLAENTNHMMPLEQAVLRKATQSGLAQTADATDLACELPPGISRVAWAPLWGEQKPGEQKPIGILIAEDLPQEQLGTLSIAANQLSLQLARIHFYQTVESMAVTDTLTGLFVRRYFMELAAEELLRSKRHDLPCTLVMADLDLFKSKNDTYGHLVGDVVLREVAQLLRRNLRGIDLIARYGGEEFILLLIETGPEQAMPIAERLRQLVEVHPIRAYDEVLSQTVSLGIACFPEDGQEFQELIERTDQALYAAKRAGRNRLVRWSPSTTVHSP